MVMESACVLFGLSKSQYQRILMDTMDYVVRNYKTTISPTVNRRNQRSQHFPNCHLIVDATELQIRVNTQTSYSGKAKMYSVKYQILVELETGKICHVFGPSLGSCHDITMYSNSGVGDWLREVGEYCLGDSGYQGAHRVIVPKKRNRELTPDEERHNNRIYSLRHTVERTFANLKKWQILRNVYRGDITEHFRVFLCCCIFTEMMHAEINEMDIDQ
jgi:hypothetical protein